MNDAPTRSITERLGHLALSLVLITLGALIVATLNPYALPLGCALIGLGGVVLGHHLTLDRQARDFFRRTNA